MKYVFAMIVGGLMITTSFLSGAVVGGLFVHNCDEWAAKKKEQEDRSVEV